MKPKMSNEEDFAKALHILFDIGIDLKEIVLSDLSYDRFQAFTGDKEINIYESDFGSINILKESDLEGAKNERNTSTG